MGRRTTEKFLVRMINGYALRFKPQRPGQTAVADAEATVFLNRDDAIIVARTSGLRWDQFTIEPINEPKTAA